MKNSTPSSQFSGLKRPCKTTPTMRQGRENVCSSKDVTTLILLSMLVNNALKISIKTRRYRHPTKKRRNRILFTLAFRPKNHRVRSIILKEIKILQNDPGTSQIFSLTPHVSFKLSSQKRTRANSQPGVFKYAHAFPARLFSGEKSPSERDRVNI